MDKSILLIFNLLFFSYNIIIAQTPIDSIELQKFYKINNNESVYLPLGNMAFADSVISYIPGIPSPQSQYSNPIKALGEPDYNYYMDDSYVSLGCKGQLTLMFTNSGFIDIEGDDLYFFEIGPSIESFKVEISKDGKNWIYIGTVPGSNCSIDIGNSQRVRTEKEIYYYVRLTDLGDFCRGPTPGADIDAVGVIGGVLKFNLAAKVLFASDDYELKNEAIQILDELIKVLKLMPYAYVKIEGHTDGDASKEYNYILGKNRAESVKKYIDSLLNYGKNPLYIGLETESFGKTMPIADNFTEGGKQKNRRVEIMIIPPESFFIEP